jgi:chromate transporter
MDSPLRLHRGLDRGYDYSRSCSTVLPAPYFKKYGKHPSIKAFVEGITAAAVGAIGGAVLVLGKRQITDVTSAIIALVTIVVLLKLKKVQEPVIIAVAALIGLALKTWL